MIISDHESGRRLQWRAAGVFISAAGRDYRLLADHAVPAHLANTAARIGDPPITREQLDREFTLILDRHVVRPQETTLLRLGLVLEEIGLHRNADVARDLFVKVFGQARGSTVMSVFTELAMKQPSCA